MMNDKYIEKYVSEMNDSFTKLLDTYKDLMNVYSNNYDRNKKLELAASVIRNYQTVLDGITCMKQESDKAMEVIRFMKGEA